MEDDALKEYTGLLDQEKEKIYELLEKQKILVERWEKKMEQIINMEIGEGERRNVKHKDLLDEWYTWKNEQVVYRDALERKNKAIEKTKEDVRYERMTLAILSMKVWEAKVWREEKDQKKPSI